MLTVFYTNYLSTHLFWKRKISNCQLPGTNIIKNNLIFFSLKTMSYIENYRKNYFFNTAIKLHCIEKNISLSEILIDLNLISVSFLIKPYE
jgi:uncharacterized membrane protein